MPMLGVHKKMLRQPQRGLDGFSLIPRYKPLQMLALVFLNIE